MFLYLICMRRFCNLFFFPAVHSSTAHENKDPSLMDTLASARTKCALSPVSAGVQEKQNTCEITFVEFSFATECGDDNERNDQRPERSAKAASVGCSAVMLHGCQLA